MIEVKVGGLIPDRKTRSHVLLLKLPGSSRYLPVWIGDHEASAIDMAVRKQEFERPLTHDLLKSVIDGLGAEVSRVVITTIQDNTFFARILLTRDHEIISVDARPSDSVALAVRAGCPIFLTEELLESQADNLYEFEDPTGAEANDPARQVDELLKSMGTPPPRPEADDDEEESGEDDA